MYVGDDVGDLPAFDALDRLAERGTAAVKVAVRTPDASPELLAAADLLVDGPDGAVTLLATLA
jgi:trehalose 6-phosphate phosphatase